jgi:hypothetical protein
MKELAALIEIYKSPEAAFQIREKLDHIEISQLIEETLELRKDPNIRNQEEVDRDWEEFKKENNFDQQIIVGGKPTTINELMSF